MKAFTLMKKARLATNKSQKECAEQLAILTGGEANQGRWSRLENDPDLGGREFMTVWRIAYVLGVEPWEPNITALLDRDKLKWKRFVEDGTPIPTAEDDAEHAGKIGAFEGAGYAAKGLYRPAKNCKMFSKGNRDFCKVCEQGLIDVIQYYSPSSSR